MGTFLMTWRSDGRAQPVPNWAAELVQVFSEWYRLSKQFLDPAKTLDGYFQILLAKLTKVRVPTGEGETNKKALEPVSKLPTCELPIIPGMPEAPGGWRRLAALHRELSHSSLIGIDFLSYRDAGKVCDGLTHQAAHTITGALCDARRDQDRQQRQSGFE